MKKALSVVALIAVLISTVSAYTGRVYKAAEGFKAPDLVIENSDSLEGISLAGLKGKYVLLNFWSSADASSRIRAKEYDLMTEFIDSERFCHVAVNLDECHSLFREIMRHDGLNAKVHHHFTDAANSGRMTDDWHLNTGLRSFLIDPEGRIAAVNPADETLRRIIGR